MPLFSVEATRVIEGEFEVEAENEDDAHDKVNGMNNDEFMRAIDTSTDEIEVGSVEALDDEDEDDEIE
jgi:hypothetical protein